MCGGGGGGGWGGVVGAVVGGAVGYMSGGFSGLATGAISGATAGGAIGSALDPADIPELKMPAMEVLDIKGPASSNMGTGETGALVELGSDSAKAQRLSTKGTGSQASGSNVAGLGAGGLRI